MIDIYNITLSDVLPESLKNDSEVKALAEAITPELLEVSSLIVECILLARIDELQEEVLDMLAWQLHVDFYETDLPLSQKQELVKKSIIFHKKKGTPQAVEDLIIAIFGDGQVQEWFEYGGQPFHFKVLTNNGSATTTDVERFEKAVESVKNLRSVLEAVEVTLTDDMELYLAGVVHVGEYYTARQVT